MHRGKMNFPRRGAPILPRSRQATGPLADPQSLVRCRAQNGSSSPTRKCARPCGSRTSCRPAGSTRRPAPSCARSPLRTGAPPGSERQRRARSQNTARTARDPAAAPGSAHRQPQSAPGDSPPSRPPNYHTAATSRRKCGKQEQFPGSGQLLCPVVSSAYENYE